jgi:hypothetical protein
MATTKDYASIARRKIRRPGDGKGVVYHKLFVYAANKKGKTDFSVSAGIPETLVLDPEHGTDWMVQRKPNVWDIDQWEDMDDAYRYLRLGKHDYQWVSVDGLTRMHNMALRYVMKVGEERDLSRRPGFIDGRDHNKAGQLSKDMLMNFFNLPMNVVFTAQEKIDKGTQTEEDEAAEEAASMIVPDLPPGVRGTVNSLVEVIGRLYVVKVKVRDRETKEIVERDQRRLWIAPHPRYATGARSEYDLPDYLKNPTVPKLTRLMTTGE